MRVSTMDAELFSHFAFTDNDDTILQRDTRCNNIFRLYCTNKNVGRE